MKQKIKQKTVESLENLKKEAVTSVKHNFTELKSELLAQLTGKEPKHENKNNQNFTPFDESVRKKMGDEYGKQDQNELDDVRKKLAQQSNPQEAIRRQFDVMRKEEREAIEELKRREMERKQREEEERQRQLQQQHSQVQSSDEPSTKQKRGMLFGGKKRKASVQTVENRAAKGKQ